MATRAHALEVVSGVLGQFSKYIEDHDTLNDFEELNAKYVPTDLQDNVTWAIDMLGRLLNADPHEPDHPNAVNVPPQPPAAT